MSIMLHPIEDAEPRASVRFSCISVKLSFPLLIALSSIISGTVELIILLYM